MTDRKQRWNIAAGGAAIIASVALGALGFFGFEVARVHSADVALRQLSSATLEARRREKDLLARFDGEGGADSYKNEKYYLAQQAAVSDAHRELDVLWDRLPSFRESELAPIRSALVDYSRFFHEVARAQAVRGNNLRGVVGRWKRAVKELVGALARERSEAAVQALLGLVPPQQSYALNPTAEASRQVDAALARIHSVAFPHGAEPEVALAEALSAYRESWAALSTLDRERGWTEDEGLRGQMRTAAHAVQPRIDRLVTHVAEADAHAIVAGAFAALVFAATLSFLVTLLLVTSARRRSKAEALVAQNRALEEARRDVERALAVKSEFLAIMNHELRTPLNAVICSAAILERAPEELPSVLPEIVRAAESQLHLVNGVLELTGMTGDAPSEPEAFVPSEIAHEVRSLHQSAAEAKGLVIEVVDDPESRRWVEGDVDAVRRILANLVDNAIKFTPRGKVAIRVSAEAGQDESLALTFVVKDSGPGIPDELRPRLFDPFLQLESATTRRFGGAGVGLAVSKALAERMDATLDVLSNERNGLAIRMRCDLPLVEVPAVSSVPAQWPSSARMQAVSSVRVLVVDDGLANRMLLKSLLKTMGIDADLASDGEAALEAHRRNGYELIFMDYHMPGMDGAEATRRIRREPGSQPRIVGITADARGDVEEKCLAAGMDRFMTKPIRVVHLEALFLKVFGRSRFASIRPGALDSEPGCESEARLKADVAASKGTRTANG